VRTVDYEGSATKAGRRIQRWLLRFGNVFTAARSTRPGANGRSIAARSVGTQLVQTQPGYHIPAITGCSETSRYRFGSGFSNGTATVATSAVAQRICTCTTSSRGRKADHTRRITSSPSVRDVTGAWSRAISKRRCVTVFAERLQTSRSS